MADEHRFDLNFACSELADDFFRVTRMTGREHISEPFAFEITVTPIEDVPLIGEDFEAMLASTSTLSFGPEREHPIHGVVRRVQMHPIGLREAEYVLTFVPRFSDLRLTRGSWIYQEKTVQEIITDAFKLGGDQALVEGDDFSFSLDGSYLPREYTVQYEESVFNFISRQAEHWGIHYHFDHLPGVDQIVFGDMNSHFPQLEGFETIGFEPTVGTTVTEAVRSIGLAHQLIEKQVSLREYNYRIPSVELVTPMMAVDGLGIGDVHLFGDHFTTPDEGGVLARIRSEERFCRKLRMNASSTVRGLRAGHRFMLSGAMPEAYGLGREYLVVSVQHSYHTGDETSADSLQYSNELLLQPLEAPFRPARLARQPKIYGMMHAKIDAEAEDESNVPCDDWGRYKVVMPFDVAGTTGGKSSCWIRVMTPSGGSGYGYSQGLHNEIEVGIIHIEGDPDRPVIGGALSNFEQPASVRAENANQTVMGSRQGIVLSFTDS